VKPVNRDDLPILRGIDGLKTGSPLGVEPKDGGITGKSGFSTGSAAPADTTTPTPVEAAPKISTPPATTIGAGDGAKNVPATTGSTSEKRGKPSVAEQVPAVAKVTP